MGPHGGPRGMGLKDPWDLGPMGGPIGGPMGPQKFIKILNKLYLTCINYLNRCHIQNIQKNL